MKTVVSSIHSLRMRYAVVIRGLPNMVKLALVAFKKD
jgi:ABC-type arginine transport system permease subunit